MADDRERVERMLEQDRQACYRAYQPPEPSPELVDRIVGAVAADERRSVPDRRFSGRAGWLLAVAAAVALVGALVVLARSGDDWQRRRAGRTATSLSLGSRAKALLEPGAAIAWLEGADRRVTVRQEAGGVTYEVARGSQAFVVETPAAVVQVLGTRFRVELVGDERSESRTETKHEEADVNRRSKGLVGAAAVAAVIVTVYQGRVLVENDGGKAEARAGERAEARPGEAPVVATRRGALSAATEPTSPRRARRLASKQAREALLALIAKARTRREERLSDSPNVPTGNAEGDQGRVPEKRRATGSLPKDYIRSVITDAKPMIADCYKLARDTVPELAGKLIVKFTIVGEPEVGGIVESVAIPDDSPLARHPTLRECVEQTLLSLEFDKPEGGGRLHVTYPFRFAPAPPKP